MADIKKLEDKLAKLKLSSSFGAFLPKTSGWLSRKLLVALALIGGLIFLGRDNITLVIYGMIILGSIYMITQTLHDIFTCREDGATRRALIAAMAADGNLSSEELAVLGGEKTDKKTDGAPITG